MKRTGAWKTSIQHEHQMQCHSWEGDCRPRKGEWWKQGRNVLGSPVLVPSLQGVRKDSNRVRKALQNQFVVWMMPVQKDNIETWPVKFVIEKLASHFMSLAGCLSKGEGQSSKRPRPSGPSAEDSHYQAGKYHWFLVEAISQLNNFPQALVELPSFRL